VDKGGISQAALRLSALKDLSSYRQ